VITRESVVAEARTWIGTRWQHQAFLKGVATDCIGLIGGVALELGMEGAREWADDPTFHSYGKDPQPGLLVAGCEKFLVRIPIEDVKLADVLVMAFKTQPQHFAIVSREEPRYIIHAYIFARKVVEQGAVVPRARLLYAYRYREFS
jgi:NlpC/P60 family putative phage cell wall peptidase